MRHPVAIPVLVILATVLLAAGCTLLSPGAKVTPAPVPTPVPTTVTQAPTTPAPCGFTTCHGLSLSCGANAPAFCTEEYRIGDKCRQFARCDSTGGTCTLVTDPKYSRCKACVEQCEIQAGADSLAASSCEERC